MGRPAATWVLLLASCLVAPVYTAADPGCPALFTGTGCTRAVDKLPTCVNGAFPGSWLTLHKGKMNANAYEYAIGVRFKLMHTTADNTTDRSPRIPLTRRCCEDKRIGSGAEGRVGPGQGSSLTPHQIILRQIRFFVTGCPVFRTPFVER